MADQPHRRDTAAQSTPGDPEAPTTATPAFPRPSVQDPDGPTVATPTYTRPPAPASPPPDPDGPTRVVPRYTPPAPPAAAPQQQWPPQPPTPTAPMPSAAPPPPTPPPPASAPAPAAPPAAQPDTGSQWPAASPQQPGWPPPGGAPNYPPGPPTGYGPPVRRRNNALIAGIAGGALALVVIVVVAFTLSSRGEGAGGASAGPSGSPAEVVTAYLEALRDGDAEKALSYSKAEPASTDFLTDAVLRKQNAEMPISDIRILDRDEGRPNFGFSTLKVAVNFGDTISEGNLSLTEVDGSWKLNNAFIKLDTQSLTGTTGAAKTLTLFGEPVASRGAAYVFPGILDVTSDNDYLTVEGDFTLDLQALAGGSSFLQPTFTLSDEGNDAVAQTVADAFATCERFKAIDPPGCPYRLDRPDAVEGTVTWGPADLSQVSPGYFDPKSMTTTVQGPVVMPVRTQTTSGQQASGEVNEYFAGTVDLTTTPPQLNLE
ncbi:hypothetical protein ACAG24_024655 [Mycobacterium sp. pW049]|uniref:hypothetical protein n=1 Tax=[Mycobacterium] bulgaricum TaxID=3238985 RepID=UPI00351B3042